MSPPVEQEVAIVGWALLVGVLVTVALLTFLFVVIRYNLPPKKAVAPPASSHNPAPPATTITPPTDSPPVADTPSPPQQKPFWKRAGRMIFGLLIWCSLIVGALWVVHEFVLPFDQILTQSSAPHEAEVAPPSDKGPQTKEEISEEWNTTPYFGKMGMFILAIAIACVIIFFVIVIIQLLMAIPFFRIPILFIVIAATGGLIIYGPDGLQRKMHEWIEWANMPWGVTRVSSPPEKVISRQYPNPIVLRGGERLEIRIPDGTCIGYPNELKPLIKKLYGYRGRWYEQLSLGQDPDAVMVWTKDPTPSYSIIFRYMRGDRGTCS